jgi:ATP-dependent Lhr-like helicase
VRGGRFVNGFGGEQFALPEVLDSLRNARDRRMPFTVTMAGADPMNLIGVLLPGDRTPAVPGKSFTYGSEEIRPAEAVPLHIVRRRGVRAAATRVAERVQSPAERQVRLF